MAPRTSIAKKILLSMTVTVLFFVLLEGVLALVGVEPELYSSDPYVGFSSSSRLFVEDPSPNGKGELVTADNKLTLFNAQRFPKNKGGAFRIFCVGGSTTFGRPYGDATSFCGWLREILPVADPGRQWEVINAGGVSYASYRVAILMEELVEYDPDLFIIYSGHNEFLERRTYPQIIAMPKALRGLGGVAAKTRTYAAMSAVVHGGSGRGTEPETDPSILSEEVTTLLDSAVGPSAYTRDDELAEKIIQHFRFNLARMVDIASSVGAEVVLITPAANLRDSRPFKSERRAGLSEADIESFDRLVNEAAQAHREGRLDESIETVEAAAAIDPRYAQLAFLQGRLLAEAKRWNEARRAFERARDEDICPLRALGPMIETVREVAAEREVPLVDFVAVADDRAADGIPGADLFLDHVHPTIQFHRVLAMELIDELARRGIVELAPGWGDAAVAEVVERVEGDIDAETHALALMKLSKVLGWAGKLQESYRLAGQAVELYPDDSRIQYNAGLTAHLVGRKMEAARYYTRAIELQPDADEPHGNLGVLLKETGQLEVAVEHFRQAIRFARTPETASRNRANLAEALMLMGYREYSRGSFNEAMAHLTEASEIAPGDPEILSRLGIVQLATGKPADGVRSFETALLAKPDDAALNNRLALALALDGEVDRAASVYRRAIQLDPRVAELPDNMFRVLGNMGRTDLIVELRVRVGE